MIQTKWTILVRLATLLVACGFPVVVPPHSAHADPPKESSREESSKKPTLIGAWEIQGEDAAKVKWTGTLVLKEGDAAGGLSGFIDWQGSDGTKGREHVSVTYSADSRVLQLKGERVEMSSGLIPGKYTAELSSDGSRLMKGKWSEGGSAGMWHATRIADKPAAASPTASPSGAKSKDAKPGFTRKRIKKEDGSFASYDLFVPHNYARVESVPVLLFLHGLGETKGNGGEPVKVGLGPYIAQHEKTFPFLTIFPQAEEDNWKARGPTGKLALEILDATLKEYHGDPKRVSLTGLSLGGFGTWNFALAEPERWAAIVPICGGGNPEKAERIKDIPCWAFHGTADDRIPIAKSRDMVAALKAAGGKPRFTEFPGVGHNSWDRAYHTPELWKWLEQQARK